MSGLADWLGTGERVIPAGRAAGRPLYAVIAVMSFLASLALGFTIAITQVAGEWSDGLSQAVTVQIKPSEVMAPSEQMEEAVAILRATPGILSVEAVSRSDAEALLEPWLGRGNLPAEIGLPQLIDVRIDLENRPDLVSLARTLEDRVPGATLDDHVRWKTRLLAFSASIQGLSLAALALIVLATVSIVIFATRAAMAANREVVEVLHLIGATDSFIAREFQGHFLRLGLIAGLIGAVLAVATLFFIAQLAGGGGAEYFLPGLSVGWTTYLTIMLIPALAALVAMITARLTAMNVIGRTV